METKKRVLQTGSRVRVHEAHDSYLRWRIGTIARHYGDINYAVFEVRFDDGRSELFWHYELLEAA